MPHCQQGTRPHASIALKIFLSGGMDVKTQLKIPEQ